MRPHEILTSPAAVSVVVLARIVIVVALPDLVGVVVVRAGNDRRHNGRVVVAVVATTGQRNREHENQKIGQEGPFASAHFLAASAVSASTVPCTPT